MAGLESFLTYDERSLGRAGTSHVSLYNGNLVFIHGDTSENGNLMPVSVSHVYNSCDAGQDMWRMGYGWRTSMHLTLHREVIPDQTGTNVTYYGESTGDGSRRAQGTVLCVDKQAQGTSTGDGSLCR